MYNRKPNTMISMIFIFGIAATSSVSAANLTDRGGEYFKGQMATCLSRARVVYPCVSFSPPAYYQTNSTFVTNMPLVTNLPLDTHELSGSSSWLAKLEGSDYWNPSGLFSSDVHGMDLNKFNAEDSEAGMNMNLGPMKLNMYIDDEHFSDSRFFLGIIDRHW